MVALSLDCLTLTDCEPVDAIRAAAAAGFDCVSLWASPAFAFPLQALTVAKERECRAALAETGLRVHSLEAFDLVSVAAVQEYRPALELGARLGGRSVLAYHGSNADRAQACDALAALVELAAELELSVNVEPVALARTRTLADADALINDARVDAGILFDSLHFVRSGSSIDDLRALPAGRIRYVQLNDGPAHVPPENLMAEAMGERACPGEGEFPLTSIARLLPTDVPWGVEAPSLRRVSEGQTPTDQAVAAMSAMQSLLAQIEAS